MCAHITLPLMYVFPVVLSIHLEVWVKVFILLFYEIPNYDSIESLVVRLIWYV